MKNTKGRSTNNVFLLVCGILMDAWFFQFRQVWIAFCSIIFHRIYRFLFKLYGIKSNSYQQEINVLENPNTCPEFLIKFHQIALYRFGSHTFAPLTKTTAHEFFIRTPTPTSYRSHPTFLRRQPKPSRRFPRPSHLPPPLRSKRARIHGTPATKRLLCTLHLKGKPEGWRLLLYPFKAKRLSRYPVGHVLLITKSTWTRLS